jgi:hypothetical protein
MKRFWTLGVVLALFPILTATGASAQGGAGARRSSDAAPTGGPLPTIEQRASGMKKMDGFFPVYLDTKADHLYLEIAKLDVQFLYVRHIANGAGTAGLNRGAVSQPLVVHFSRVGPKVMLTAENTEWRTSSDEPAQQAAVKQAFPESVLAAFPIAAEDADDHVLVDATDFFTRDAQDFAGRLGTGYRQDPARSMVVPENTKNFPLNTEIETLLTYTDEGSPTARAAGGGGGGFGEQNPLAAVAPDAHNITLRERQSLIQLPDAGYKPRVWDPRAGSIVTTSFNDWSKPLGESRVTRYLTRFRLEKKDPTKAVSDPIKPIVYYVDRGAPEPIRTALLEGVRWWNDAFLAAGFSNAFKAELMPEGADPLDIRYNVILWVEGENRAFSNGLDVIDPRTGEILKGEVTLTSGRERQDFLITDALLSPYKTGDQPDPQQTAMVLQRMRQLSAHESGHTIGLSHNHASSAIGMGESVEDYPFPKIQITPDGKLDLSHAYEPGLGEWDKVSIDFAYHQFPPGTAPAQEKAGLDKIIADAAKRGMYYMIDEGPASVHPHSSQWDNGPNSAAELDRLLKVREIAMKNFSESAIRPGVPVAELEDVLVPVYLLHRYQTEAAAQSIGGLDYRYAVRGDGQMITKTIPGDEQRAALTAVLKTLDPQMLTLPESLLEKFPPRPPNMPRNQESFMGYAGPVFDPMAPVMAAADTTLDALLEPGRATRLMEFHARDASLPSLSEVLDALLKVSWYAPPLQGLASESQMTVNEDVLEHMVTLSNSPAASPLAKAVVKTELTKLRAFATEHAKDTAASAESQAFYSAALDQMSGRGGGGGAVVAAAPGAAPGGGGRGGRGAAATPTSIPAGAPIEPDLTFMPDQSAVPQ